MRLETRLNEGFRIIVGTVKWSRVICAEFWSGGNILSAQSSEKPALSPRMPPIKADFDIGRSPGYLQTISELETTNDPSVLPEQVCGVVRTYKGEV